MDTQILQIGVERVRPGRWQPRDRCQLTDESLAELAADIRQRGQHYQRDALLAYVLRKWDELGDGRVGTLLNAAASERAAMDRKTNSRSPGYDVYNPALDNEERWIAISWQSYRDGRKPFSWPDGIEWPFVEEGRA